MKYTPDNAVKSSKLESYFAGKAQEEKLKNKSRTKLLLPVIVRQNEKEGKIRGEERVEGVSFLVSH